MLCIGLQKFKRPYGTDPHKNNPDVPTTMYFPTDCTSARHSKFEVYVLFENCVMLRADLWV